MTFWKASRATAAAMLVAVFAVLSLVIADVIIPPSLTGDQHAAFVLFQGAGVDAELYRPLVTAIQSSAAVPVWVAVPAFPFSVPDPLTADSTVRGALAKLTAAGMPANASIVLAGHSLGSVIISSFTANTTLAVVAQILMGGYIARSFHLPSFAYPVPTLTVAGELDGLSRVTRAGAEAYYHQIQINPNATGATLFPVTVVPGMSHWQFASGKPTSFVQSRDLTPEISLDTAHAQTAALVVDYVQARLPLALPNAGAVVARAVRATAVFVAPLVAGYELEGSRHFNAPRQIGGPLQKPACDRGLCPDTSEWVRRAQEMVTGPLPGSVSLNVTNAYVDVSANPVTGGDFHLPKATLAGSVLTITTYGQGRWDMVDGTDAAFASTSANELAAKLLSRQCSLIAATGQNVSFAVDDPDFCRQANEAALQWALDAAGPVTRARFLAHGVPFVFQPDLSKSGGPFFINAHVTLSRETVNGTTVVPVASPMQKTEKDYWIDHFPFPRPSFIPDPGCYHYCKLLSPARAMEWIYVDSLRGTNSSGRTEAEVGVEQRRRLAELALMPAASR